MRRTLRLAYWLLPPAFCIALYWLGLRIWFAQDDFAWLGLRNHVTDFRSFLWAMFTPLAQGTIRPWSERAFFMLFSYFFGLRALPYRVFVFLNELLNVVLVMLIARKLTRSQLAGFLAPLFWLSNIALIGSMSWNSSYNEIQCATFLLLSFYLFVRYTETDARKYYWAQGLTFVLGFGSLEINVVYPAIAALYAWLFARRFLRSTLPMFAMSAIFAILHSLAAPASRGFYYDMNFHAGSLLATLGQYWSLLMGVPIYGRLNNWRPQLVLWAVALLTAGILVFVVCQSWKRRFLPLFFLGWFLIVLAPLLPLHNHVSEYYLTIPAIGVAMLAAHALAAAAQNGWAYRAPAAALALLYFIPSLQVVRAGMQSYFDRADRVRALVQSVAYAKHIHPGKMILLRGVDDQLFWAGIYDHPFLVFGWADVLLAPDSRNLVNEDPHHAPLDRYFLPESDARRALDSGSAIVYSVEGKKLRNVTASYSEWIHSRPLPDASRQN